ncbi:hypothetical protein E4U55_003496 [Claviceps digitariae]|nr:hypothetical protein E4U55_003496 [Claviceps digitariae]
MPEKGESMGTYHIKDFSLTHVRCMVDFFYTGTYMVHKPLSAAVTATAAGGTKTKSTTTTTPNTNTNTTPNEKWNIDDPVLHAIMFALGDKYLINDLKNCAKTFYRSSLYHQATTAEAFLRSVREVYTRTTDEMQHGRELRWAALKAGLQKFGMAMVSDECRSLCNEVIGECPAFASDILTPLMRKMEDERLGRRCDYCGTAHPPEDYLAPLPCPGQKEMASYGSPKSSVTARDN